MYSETRKVLVLPNKWYSDDAKKRIQFLWYIDWDVVIDLNDNSLFSARVQRSSCPRSVQQITQKAAKKEKMIDPSFTYVVRSLLAFWTLPWSKTNFFVVGLNQEVKEVVKFYEIFLYNRSECKSKEVDTIWHLHSQQNDKLQSEIANLGRGHTRINFNDDIFYDFDILAAVVYSVVNTTQNYTLFHSKTGTKMYHFDEDKFNFKKDNQMAFELLSYETGKNETGGEPELQELSHAYHTKKIPLPWHMIEKRFRVAEREKVEEIVQMVDFWDEKKPLSIVLKHGFDEGGTSIARMALYKRHMKHVCVYISKPEKILADCQCFLIILKQLCALTQLPVFLCIDQGKESRDSTLTLFDRLKSTLSNLPIKPKILLVLPSPKFIPPLPIQDTEVLTVNNPTPQEIQSLRDCLHLREKLKIYQRRKDGTTTRDLSYALGKTCTLEMESETRRPCFSEESFMERLE